MIHPYLLAVAPVSIYLSNLMINFQSFFKNKEPLTASAALHQIIVYTGFCLALYAYVENSKDLSLALTISGFVIEVLGFWFSIWQMQEFSETNSVLHFVYVIVRGLLFGLVLACAIVATSNKYQHSETLWIAMAVHAINFAGSIKFGVLDWYVASNREPVNAETDSEKGTAPGNLKFDFDNTPKLRKRKQTPPDEKASFYL